MEMAALENENKAALNNAGEKNLVEETCKQPLNEDGKFESTDNLVNDEVVEQPAHEVLSDKSVKIKNNDSAASECQLK